MRHILLILFFCLVYSLNCWGQTTRQYEISETDALNIVTRTFEGKDYDYYLISDNLSKEFWTILVDAEPLKGWEHQCYIVQILKKSSLPATQTAPYSIIESTNPKIGQNVKSLKVKNRILPVNNLKPKVLLNQQTNDINPMASRTYALILSGGSDPVKNKERYWNDCSFIYQTLRNKYGVPKENIYPLLSDGNDPGADMNAGEKGIIDQSLDLDFDGLPDIELAATYENVELVLNTVVNKMSQDDHLFIFVIDHGGWDKVRKESLICLWNYGSLYASDLSGMLEQFTEKLINVNVVLGQCNAGGFIPYLMKNGCVVSAACRYDQPSFALSSIPYDEFVYNWTCAVNEADHLGNRIVTDADNNCFITIDEAYRYALSKVIHDTPIYTSTPISIGEDLAFDKSAVSIDLYVKDNPEDTGKEPNLTTDKFWLSPSVWIRNSADGIYEHENPIYSPDHTAATIYVRVHNRGKDTYPGGTYYVHAYWALASTGFNPDAWMGNELYENGEVTGGPLRPSVIPKIDPGEYADVAVNWALPDDILGTVADNGTEKHHFCILAKIMNTHVEPWYNGTFTYDCQKNNDDAQINVSIISTVDLTAKTSVFVRNIIDTSQKYSLELIPRSVMDEEIYSLADIEMTLNPLVYEGWKRGGFHANHIITNNALNENTVVFTDIDSRLESVLMSSKEFDKVGLKFNFKSVPGAPRSYTLDLIQKDENGNIIGGETFIVDCPVESTASYEIRVSSSEDDLTMLNIETASNDHVRWKDFDDRTISESSNVTVRPEINGYTYNVYVLSEEGELYSDTVNLPQEKGIMRVSTSGIDSLEVTLFDEAGTDCLLLITSAHTGESVLTMPMTQSQSHAVLDISTLAIGNYSLSYIQNGKVINSVKFIKQ